MRAARGGEIPPLRRRGYKIWNIGNMVIRPRAFKGGRYSQVVKFWIFRSKPLFWIVLQNFIVA